MAFSKSDFGLKKQTRWTGFQDEPHGKRDENILLSCLPVKQSDASDNEKAIWTMVIFSNYLL
ncbi:MAG: hypothetical protein Fur0043_25140 [Anaerolineales bacterium]